MSHNSDSEFTKNQVSPEIQAIQGFSGREAGRHHPSDRPENSISLAGELNKRPGPSDILPAVTGQREFLEKMLSGSQKKTAFAIRMNAERMIREGGLNSTGFLTLTVGEHQCPDHGEQVPVGKRDCPVCGQEMAFHGVQDAGEASRRIDNLRRRVLSVFFERSIVVTERHKSGKIHFHILGVLTGRPDIRTGFDFKNFHKALDARAQGWVNNAAEYHYKTSATEELRSRWALLREILPKYGFGRAQLTPVEKTGEAVAGYISKYIEKNVCNRTEDDKHKKLVRYIGWEKQQLKPNEFEWNGERAQAWRGKARELVGLLGAEIPDRDFNLPQHVTDCCFWSGGKIRQKMLDGRQAADVLGSRWAYHVHELITRVSDQAVPFMVWDYREREVVRRELFLKSERGHVQKMNFPGIWACGEGWKLPDWKQFMEFFNVPIVQN